MTPSRVESVTISGGAAAADHVLIVAAVDTDRGQGDAYSLVDAPNIARGTTAGSIVHEGIGWQSGHGIKGADSHGNVALVMAHLGPGVGPVALELNF